MSILGPRKYARLGRRELADLVATGTGRSVKTIDLI